MFPGPSPGAFLMPIYALIPAWPLPSSRPRVIGPQAPGLPQMSGQCLAHLGLSSEVLQLGWGRGCLPLLQFLLQGLLQAGPQSLCLEEAAIRQVVCVCLGGCRERVIVVGPQTYSILNPTHGYSPPLLGTGKAECCCLAGPTPAR